MSATKGGDSDYSDEDIEENASDFSLKALQSSVTHHPRPIAAPRHSVGASTSMAATSSTSVSGSQDPIPIDLSFQASQFPDFSLPVTSAELGSLPVYDFTYDPSAFYPSQDFNADMAGATFEANLQESDYTSRTMAESLSTAFGHLGPDAFFMPFGEYGHDGQNQGSDSSQGDSNQYAASLNQDFGPTNWNLYMTGLDDVLRSQDFSSVT